MPDYLIDASSLFKLLSYNLSADTNLLENSCITDLTLFEIGNALFKRKDSSIKEISLDKIMTLSGVIGNILKEIPTVSISAAEISGILGIAINTKISFYDASYIYICDRDHLKLITDDLELKRKAASEKVAVFELMDVLKN